MAFGYVGSEDLFLGLLFASDYFLGFVPQPEHPFSNIPEYLRIQLCKMDIFATQKIIQASHISLQFTCHKTEKVSDTLGFCAFILV